jgi:predicted nucleic acid-binding protein
VGLILDSSIVIAAERRGDSVEALIEEIVSSFEDQDSALSSIRLTELIHGIYRATTPELRLRRQLLSTTWYAPSPSIHIPRRPPCSPADYRASSKRRA